MFCNDQTDSLIGLNRTNFSHLTPQNNSSECKIYLRNIDTCKGYYSNYALGLGLEFKNQKELNSFLSKHKLKKLFSI
jgi:hypothetical protein